MDIKKTERIDFKSHLQFNPGDRFGNRYQIMELIGEGGMGKVFKAKDMELDIVVALKMIKEELSSNPEIISRFKKELLLTREIVHENVIRIHDLGEIDGIKYISMNHIEGKSLEKIISESEKLTIEETIHISRQMAEALEAAHNKGIIHRDLNPKNVMLDEQGKAYVLDFGIARSVSDETSLTGTGIRLGTPNSMSPEQVRGDDIDIRSDIYSFGIMMYKMVTGKLPYEGESLAEIYHKVETEKPAPPTKINPDIPPFLNRIILTCIDREPGKRYSSIGEILEELEGKKFEQNVEIKEKTSIFKHLWRRNVLQVLGIYLGAGWLISEVIHWIVNRFLLSPYLVDFSRVTILSLVPSVIIFTYFYRKSGPRRGIRIKRFSIPANLVVSILLLFVIFSGKELGTVTQSVVIEDDEGKKIERTIPKKQFRKKMAIFFFDNQSGNPKLDWLQYAIPLMIEFDLDQDLFIEMETGFNYHSTDSSDDTTNNIRSKAKEAGFLKAIKLPFMLKRKISNELHSKYFVSGEFEKKEDNYLIKIALYKTKTGQLVEERNFEGSHIYKLTDKISKQLKYDLDIPSYHIENTTDLPISEIMPPSIAAMKEYTEGMVECLLNNNWIKGVEHYEKAVKEDPSFALGYFSLRIGYRCINKEKKAKHALEILMKYLYKLPERVQFSAKVQYHIEKKDLKKGLAVVKRQAELYPDDLAPHITMAEIYKMSLQLDQMLSVYKRILEIDPEQYEYLRKIGALYQIKEKFETALEYFKKYARQFPEDYKSYIDIGDLYLEMNDLKQARSHYEKALALEPQKFSILIKMGNIEEDSGNFKLARKHYEEALKLCKISQDRATVYKAMETYYILMGQIKRSIQYMNLKNDEIKKFNVPIMVLMQKALHLSKYVYVGQEETAFKILKKIERLFSPPAIANIYYGYSLVYLEMEDADNAEKYFKLVEDILKNYGLGELMELMVIKGWIHEIRGEYDPAIALYQKISGKIPIVKEFNHIIGRCYRKAKRFDKAKEQLTKALKRHPYEPLMNYEMALLYWDMGEKEKAFKHLKRTLDIWKDADPEYIYSKKAKETLKKWESEKKD